MSSGNWPFDRWEIGSLPLREDHDYFNYWRKSTAGGMLYRLKKAFGKGGETEPISSLAATVETISDAVEHSQAEAFDNWQKHEVWLPTIDESRYAVDEPAEMLADCLCVLGPPDGFSEQRLFSAVGIWLLGEWAHSEKEKNPAMQSLAMAQAAVALAEAEWYRGQSEANEQLQKILANRNRVAAAKRHTANRERKEAARNWYLKLEPDSIKNADAARKIETDFSITFEVAKRWVTEFERFRLSTAKR